MPRLTKTSLRIQKFVDKATKSSRKALLASLCDDMYNLYTKNGNRLPYGHITVILESLKPTEPWLTRNIINKAFLNYKKSNGAGAPQQVIVVADKVNSKKDKNCSSVMDSEISDLSNVSSFEGISDSVKWNVGRPVGTTAEKKEQSEKKIIAARNEAAKKYASVRINAKKRGKRVRKGELKNIIKECTKKYEIDQDIISPLAIRRRVDRQSLECHHLAGGQVSPLADIEPLVVGIILLMACIWQCLTPSKGLALVHSIIDGTKVQEDLKKWKVENTPNSIGIVGKGYWRSLFKRYRNQIVSKRGQKNELNQQNWTTYANF